ncbi:MAG: MerR family DNA-binding protein, partial [Pseudomonadota bacterium]|nr:MerR family DNA-binding protein [Pseudomonadota bacterium]
TTRVYNYRDRGRLQIILRGKRLGFSLAEIREYLHLYDADPSQSEQLSMLLEKVNQRLKALARQKSDLAALVTELNDIRLQALDALDRTQHQTRTGTN